MSISWYEFLIMTGIISSSVVPSVKENVIYWNYDDEKRRVENHLESLGINYKSSQESIIILDPEMEFYQIDPLLQKHYGGGQENGEPNIVRNITYVEPPIRGVVVQLNRLGLPTIGSCGGHAEQSRRTRPWVAFSNRNDTQVAMELFNSLSVPVEYYFLDSLYVNLETDELYRLALRLNEILGFDDVRKNVLEFRKQTLFDLLQIPGETGNEDAVREYVVSELKTLKTKRGYLDFLVDENGNILGSVIPPRGIPRGSGRAGQVPRKMMMFAAHLDVVREFSPSYKVVVRDNIVSREKGILGADDRAGVAIILNLIKEVGDIKECPPFKFVFTVGEEQGQYGAEAIDPEFFEDVSFGISLDRKNCKDIVFRSSSQEYSTLEFAEGVARISGRIFSAENKFVPCQGGVSDLSVWSDKNTLPCVNLSIGYDDEHTNKEYLDLICWDRTHQLAKELISYYNPA